MLPPEGEVVHEGRYTNVNFLYSVTIPLGLKCLSTPPPAPHHGCGIDLSKEPKAYLWVDGGYKALDRVSSEDALREAVDSLLQEGTEMLVLKRVSTQLGDLQAERLTVRYRKAGEVEATVKDVVMSLRIVKNYGDIIYTLGLESPEARFAKDDEVFEAILSSWTNELPSESRDRKGKEK